MVLQKSSLEQSLEESRAELLAVRTNHADTVSLLEAQVNQLIFVITPVQCLRLWANKSANPLMYKNPWSAYHRLYMYMNVKRAPLLLPISTYYYYPSQTTGIQNELQHYWAPNPSSTQRWLLQSVQKKDGCTSKHTIIHEWPTDRARESHLLTKKRSAFSLDIFRHFFYKWEIKSISFDLMMMLMLFGSLVKTTFCNTFCLRLLIWSSRS